MGIFTDQATLSHWLFGHAVDENRIFQSALYLLHANRSERKVQLRQKNGQRSICGVCGNPAIIPSKSDPALLGVARGGGFFGDLYTWL